MLPVYTEMMLQIATEYSGLPDVRTLALSEIRFFYEGLRPTLRKHTKPGGGPKIPKPPKR